MNYFQLSNSFYDFLKPYDLSQYSFKDRGHDWVAVKTENFITDEGYEWFNNRGFKLREYAGLFNIPSNTDGPIHTDNPAYAVNFILSGKGDMQWITDIDATEYKSHHQGRVYSRFTDLKSFSISDTWSSGIALVRVNVPHRVVSTDSERFCLSVRFIEEESPLTFDDALLVINK